VGKAAWNLVGCALMMAPGFVLMVAIAYVLALLLGAVGPIR
jgi:hypothetical protein